jgi:glycosyltransferase involved in cell wall biosynthesis
MIYVDCRSALAFPSGLLAYQRSLATYLPEIAPDETFGWLRHRDAPGQLSQHPHAREVFISGQSESPFAPLLLKHRLHLEAGTLLHATTGFYPSGMSLPIVTTIHDLVWLTNPSWLRSSGPKGRLAAIFAKKYLNDALRLSSHIIVPSRATQRQVDEIAPFASDRVTVIAHGVREVFQPLDMDDEAAVARVDRIVSRLIGTRRFVLDVGRTAAHRNHRGLIEAFAIAFRTDPEIHLALVQPLCRHSHRLVQLANRLGLEGRVHLISGIASRDLVALYQRAICLCHPTLHAAYGTVVGEAMACGCPVITSGRAAIGEIAEGVAQLINPEHEDEIAAAMRRIAYDSSIVKRMRARGLERAIGLNPKKMAEATYAVYQKVLKGN